MKVIKLDEKNFIKDEKTAKDGAQEGWWGKLRLAPFVLRYGLVKLDYHLDNPLTFTARPYECYYSLYETFFSFIARAMKLKCVKYHPLYVEREGQKVCGVFSQSFLRKGEILEDFYITFKKYGITEESKSYCLEDYFSVFDKMPNGEKIKSGFVQKLFFNLCFMNLDYYCARGDNTALIRRGGGLYRCAPLFDLSVTSLMLLQRKDPDIKDILSLTKSCFKEGGKQEKASLSGFCENCVSFEEIMTYLAKKEKEEAQIFLAKAQNALDKKLYEKAAKAIKTLRLYSPYLLSLSSLYAKACLCNTVSAIKKAL